MQTIDNFNFAGKKAFVRVDFNVPLDEIREDFPILFFPGFTTEYTGIQHYIRNRTKNEGDSVSY